jgi:hypothetical protein
MSAELHEFPAPDDEPDAAPSTAGISPEVRGAFARLREQRAKAEQDITTVLPVNRPGLRCRYRLVGWDVFKTYMQRAGRGGGADLNGQLDLLIQACVEFEVLMADGWRSVDPDDPVRYDRVLADLLDLGTTTARATCRAVFANDVALTMHFNDLIEWMRSVGQEADDDVVGEAGRSSR